MVVTGHLPVLRQTTSQGSLVGADRRAVVVVGRLWESALQITPLHRSGLLLKTILVHER